MLLSLDFPLYFSNGSPFETFTSLVEHYPSFIEASEIIENHQQHGSPNLSSQIPWPVTQLQLNEGVKANLINCIGVAINDNRRKKRLKGRIRKRRIYDEGRCINGLKHSRGKRAADPSLLGNQIILEPHAKSTQSLEMGKWRRYIRVFAEVRIDEPLQVIGLLPMAGSIPLEFKYEKVTDYCLYCGKLGHSESRCISREEEMHAGGTGDLPEIYEYSIRAGTAPRDLSSFIRLGTNQWLDSPGGSSQSRLTPTNSPTGGLGEMVIGSSARGIEGGGGGGRCCGGATPPPTRCESMADFEQQNPCRRQIEDESVAIRDRLKTKQSTAVAAAPGATPSPSALPLPCDQVAGDETHNTQLKRLNPTTGLAKTREASSPAKDRRRADRRRFEQRERTNPKEERRYSGEETTGAVKVTDGHAISDTTKQGN
ncbi:hypothetical protein LINPERPRIM_LOCUS14630 [Linum perenne]